MKNILGLVILAGLLSAGRADAAPPAEVRSFIGGLEGQTRWLKIDVVRVQYLLRGEDATNVYFPDGLVRYQARLGMRRTESTSAEEFIRDAQRSLQQNNTEGQVRVANIGTKVTISLTKVEDKEIEVEFRDSGNSKHKIRLKFDNGYYRLDDVRKLIEVCFAESELAAKGKATVTITLGMTVDEVIKAKGAPKTRVDLGAKTILTYEDMKLVFQNGKLADVQ